MKAKAVTGGTGGTGGGSFGPAFISYHDSPVCRTTLHLFRTVLFRWFNPSCLLHCHSGQRVSSKRRFVSCEKQRNVAFDFATSVGFVIHDQTGGPYQLTTTLAYPLQVLQHRPVPTTYPLVAASIDLLALDHHWIAGASRYQGGGAGAE